MEGKKFEQTDVGQEIQYEEIADEDMTELDEPTRPSPRKMTTVWLSLLGIVLIIVVGWIFFLKYNIKKINSQLDKQTGQTTAEAQAQLQKTYDELKQIIDQSAAGLDTLKQEAMNGASKSLPLEIKQRRDYE